jgi:hypothetical protein
MNTFVSNNKSIDPRSSYAASKQKMESKATIEEGLKKDKEG